MVRGVIAAPGIINTFQGGFVMERSLSKEELRYYILYWDKVVIPGNNLVYIGVPEEDTLIACESISRPMIRFQGSFKGDQIASAILDCQSIVAKDLVQDKTVDWVLHQIGDSLLLPKNFTFKQEEVRVALVNALPVPDGEVPIHNILQFKLSRIDELTELHDSIDGLYLEILNSPDPGLATKKAISRFKAAIQNLGRVSNEKFKKTRKYDLSVELNLNGKDIMTGASAGALLDFFSTGSSIPIATALGAIMSIIKIQAKATYAFEPAKNNAKLAYIANASKEHIINQ